MPILSMVCPCLRRSGFAQAGRSLSDRSAHIRVAEGLVGPLKRIRWPLHVNRYCWHPLPKQRMPWIEDYITLPFEDAA